MYKYDRGHNKYNSRAGCAGRLLYLLCMVMLGMIFAIPIMALWPMESPQPPLKIWLSRQNIDNLDGIYWYYGSTESILHRMGVRSVDDLRKHVMVVILNRFFQSVAAAKIWAAINKER